MTAAFAHLRIHTEYSLVDSVIRIKPLMERARELGLPAVGLTDETNLFALVKFYRTALAYGIKPIVGADLWVAHEEPGIASSRVTLFCQDREGYRHLSELLSKSYGRGRLDGRAVVDRDWFTEDLAQGLLLLLGPGSDVGSALRAGRARRAKAALSFWQHLFPERAYLEVQRVGHPGEAQIVQRTVELAAQERLPVVATNDVRFLSADDYEAHEARVCIHQGRTLNDTTRPRDYTPQQYLRSPEEMVELWHDLPEAVENGLEIAKRCNLELEFGGSALPDFPVPDGQTVSEYLGHAAKEGLERRLKKLGIADAQPYWNRLREELDVICSMGFEGYFLIVADFIGWARNEGIPVGPGRGSGAGSLVAYALQITDLDPLQYDLLFERFLNPERVSMPDFDIDFCIVGRDRVIDYVSQRYGRERVSQIITYGSMAARAVVRDVGRVLGHPYGFVDRVAKLIPFEIGMTLDKALETDAELKSRYDSEEEIRTLIDLARSLEGLARNAGKHAGGVVIAPGPLVEYTPLYSEPDGNHLVTQFDKDDVEAVGLVKFDFLGLKTLTIIDRAVKIINEERTATGADPLDIESLPLDDQATFELLCACNTMAVFQLESRGMRDLIKRLQPDSFDDIVALVALFRPGPLQSGMVDDFIDRKHGRNTAPIDYLHPDLEPVLKPTYGVILYQEQVMQIAQILAGYSLGEADLLRRAMGKKKPEEMAKQRSVFMAGAQAKAVDESQASHIFDLMEKFAGYGFNKSHSAAYALIAYQTAWLKAHHPAAFMAAVMTSDMDNTDKLALLAEDCKRQSLEIVAPHVNTSDYAFKVEGGRILYGLGALKGMGEALVAAIVENRSAEGPYADLLSFCSRVGRERVNRRALEALAKSGAFDGLGPNRASMLAGLPVVMQQVDQLARSAAAGQTELFGGEEAGTPAVEIAKLAEYTASDRLVAEWESLGLFLSGHPFDEFKRHSAHFTNGTIDSIVGMPAPKGNVFGAGRKSIVAAGLVADIRRRGNRVTLLLDDNTGQLEVTLFEDVANEFRHLIAKHEILVVEGSARFDDFINGWRLSAKQLVTVDECIERHARSLALRWPGTSTDPAEVETLKSLLKPYVPGPCDVFVEYVSPEARARVALGDRWTVRPARELRAALEQWLGTDGFQLHYPKPVRPGAEIVSFARQRA